MKYNKKTLNITITSVEKALKKHKDKEDVKEAYERIIALKKKRNIE